jgi:hypothetical protein
MFKRLLLTVTTVMIALISIRAALLPDLIPLPVPDKCALADENSSSLDAFCEYPTGLSATLLDCQSHTYEFGVVGGSGSICASYWTADDYPTSLPGTIPLVYSFTTSGWHVYCAKIYCCEGGDAVWMCDSVYVPENCECILPDGVHTTLLDCPGHKYEFTLCGGNEYCVKQWCDNGVPMGNDHPWITELAPGHHVICATVYCCNNDAISTVLCTELDVPEYCCPLPTEIGVKLLSCESHKYEFTALCVQDGVCIGKWLVDDIAIASDVNPFYYDFAPGTHEICVYVYCCDSPGSEKKICVTIEVPENCECTFPDDIKCTLLDCPSHKYQFGLLGGTNLCVDAWIIDGIDVSSAYPYITNLAPGWHTVCVKLHCCSTGESWDRCIKVNVIDYCCELPTEIGVKVLDCPGHKYQFSLLCLDPSICIGKWFVDDDAMTSEVNPFIWELTPGNHTICVDVRCCENPDQHKRICVDVYVPENCDCRFPSSIMVTELDCATHTYQFGLWDANNICILEWTDNGIPIGNDYPLTIELGLGTHVICAKYYCCSNPCDVQEMCTPPIEVLPCNCIYPSGLQLLNANCIDHLYTYSLTGGSGFCIAYWNVDGTGEVQAGNYTPTFYLAPGLHTICVRVQCCNNPDVPAYHNCFEVYIPENCDCVLPDGIQTTLLDCPGHKYQFTLCGGYNYCVKQWCDNGVPMTSEYPWTTELTPGHHVICVSVICCNNDQMSTILCTEIDVPVYCCPLPTEIGVKLLSCESHKYEFTALCALDGVACFGKWFVDGNGIDYGSSSTITSLDPGTHEICVDVYCCDTYLGTQICVTVVVPENCECTFPDNIMYTMLDCPSHKYQFGLWGGTNLCVDAWIIDDIDVSSAYPYITNLAPGWHTVCVKLHCCSTGESWDRCIPVNVIDYCCELPTAIAVKELDCPGHKYQFSLLCLDPSICIGKWFVDDDAMTSEVNPFIWELTPGNHTICVDVRCCENPDQHKRICVDVYVPENCDCRFPSSIMANLVDCTTNLYQFGLWDASNICIFEWLDNDVYAGNDYPLITSLTPGFHHIIVKFYCCSNPCEVGTLELNIDVAWPCQSGTQGMAMAPGNSGITNELHNKVDAKLFPVPTESILNISYDQLVNLKELTVMNMMGEIIVRKSNLGDISTTQLDVQSLPSGVYMVTLNANGHLQHLNFVKK